MRQQHGVARLNAGLLLLYLDESSGTDGLIACLREDDPTFQLRVLSSLSTMPLHPIKENSRFWQEPPVPIKREPLFAALEPFLATPEARTGAIAVEISMRLNLSQADQHALYLLRERRGSAYLRSRILHSLAICGEDQGALDAASALLQEEHATYWTISALENYCEGQDPELAKRAAELLAEYVTAHLDRPGNDITNHIWHALDGIVAAEHAEREQILRAVLNSPIKDWRRGVALKHLGHLEGEASLQRLREALADEALRSFAAEGIAEIARDKNDAALIDALVTAAHQETRQRVLSTLVNALVAIGADAPALLSDIAERLQPDDVMRLHWLASGITPHTAANRLVEAGAIPPPSRPRLQELEEKWGRERAVHNIVTSLLADARRLTWFDTETSRVTPNYLELIPNLLDISQNVFNAEAFTQTVDEDTGESEIRFVYDGRSYAFTAQNFGDWYDVQSVIEGFNRALADSDRPERFMLLYTGDQTAAITFAPENAFRQAARELHIPIESDSGAAMQRGVELEEYVRDELKRQEQRKRQEESQSLVGRLLKRLFDRNGSRK